MIISIASSIFYSFFAAFRADTEFDSYEEYQEAISNGSIPNCHVFSKDEIKVYTRIYIIVEIFFFLEMFLGFITSYYDEN